MRSILAIAPEFAACDLHPDFLSTRSAEESGLPCARVQHHLAHVAAVAAEHGLSGPLLGVALDGQGYGADGAPWGGELIRLDGPIGAASAISTSRAAGGDRAAREPWRMGVAMLASARPARRGGAPLSRIPYAARLAQSFARGARVP